MKFIHYLEKIAQIQNYGMISLGIFFLFFLGMLIWVFRTDKKTLQSHSEIPLH